MPSDLTISSIGIPAAIPPRPPAYQSSPTSIVEPKVAGPPPPSPTVRFDATAGILVIEFHNNEGSVTDSIPTQRQLDAYRSQSEFAPPSAPQPTSAAANGAGGHNSDGSASQATAPLDFARSDVVANSGIVVASGIVTTSGVVAKPSIVA